MLLPRRSPVPPACPPRSSSRIARGAPLLSKGFRCVRASGNAMVEAAAFKDATSVADVVPQVTCSWRRLGPHDGGHPCDVDEHVDSQRRGEWYVPDPQELVDEHNRRQDHDVDDVRGSADDNDQNQASVSGRWGDKAATYVVDADNSYVVEISDSGTTTTSMSVAASTSTNIYDGGVASDCEEDSHSDSIGSDRSAASDTTRSTRTEDSSSTTGSGAATGYTRKDGLYVRGGRSAAALRQRLRTLRSFRPFPHLFCQEAQSKSTGVLSVTAGKVFPDGDVCEAVRSDGEGRSDESVVLAHGDAHKDA